MLTATSPLPYRPFRVLVAGTAGSGKTTLAGAIGTRLALPTVEIDALYHGPGWTTRPSFEADVRAFADTPAWVTEWQYRTVRDLLADRADLLVWLDLSRATVMRQVVARTLRRRLRRTRLWNGNVEPPLWTILTDADHIIRWAWSTYAKTSERTRALSARRPDLPVVALRSRAEIQTWLARLPPAGTGRDQGRTGPDHERD